MIQLAFSLEDYQVTGGPAWLGTDRYDIEAKAENAQAGKTEMSVMLQSLLADRFKLQFHLETREFPVYALVVDKNGPRLRPLKDGEASLCRRDNSFACGYTSITQLAKVLQSFVGRPVVDKTGLDGRFDLLLDFDTDQNTTSPTNSDKPSLIKALQEQLGLRLEPQKASFRMLVIEDVQRPSEN